MRTKKITIEFMCSSSWLVGGGGATEVDESEERIKSFVFEAFEATASLIESKFDIFFCWQLLFLHRYLLSTEVLHRGAWLNLCGVKLCF